MDGNLRGLTPGATDSLVSADRVCTGFADARLLDGTWRAFLSVSGTAAPSRMVGNGPWSTLDGGVVFTNATALTAGLVSANAVITLENGTNPAGARIFWTGTTTAGAVDSATCAGWTTGTSGSGASGSASTGMLTWNQGTDQCATARRLLCVEQDARPLRFSDVWQNPKRVFITRSTYNGNLGGTGGADTICNTVATARSLGGIWRAMLSNSTVRVVDRMTLRGPFTLMDGGVAFNNKAGIEFGVTATTGLSLTDEFGVPVSSATFWSGTTATGLIANNTCSGWTSTSLLQSGMTGTTGTTASPTFTWETATSRCDNMHSLICMED